MIKFFRNIRQNLIMENKTSKYLKYAIGEIVLVVIGILIAIQINNWHQNNLRLKQEKLLLSQLRIEILETYDDIFTDLIRLNYSERSHYKILDYIENDRPYNDSICLDFFLLKEDDYIYPNTAVYGKIKELGLDIIQDDSLRINVQKLYEYIFPRISKTNTFTIDISEYLDPYYRKNFTPNMDYSLKFHFPLEIDSLSGRVFKRDAIDLPQTITIDGKNKMYTIGFVPLNFEQLKKDPEFLMLLKRVDENRANKLFRYDMAEAKIREMVNAIDNLLKDD